MSASMQMIARSRQEPPAPASEQPEAPAPAGNGLPVDDVTELDAGPGLQTRAQFAEALILGEPVTSAVACLYPDLVQIADPKALPHAWMLRAIRAETGPGAPHYVLVGPDQGVASHEVFHVHVVATNRTIVSRVSAYRPVGAAEKLYHDVVSVSAAEKQLAIEVWKRVDRFVSDPAANASLVMIAKPQPADLADQELESPAEPAPRKRRARTSLVNS